MDFASSMSLTNIDFQMKQMQKEIKSMKKLMEEKDNKIKMLKQQKEMYKSTASL